MTDFDAINDELDAVTLQEFPTFEAAWTAIGQVLEAHGIEVPDTLGDDELLFHLQVEGVTEPHYLYVATDRVDPTEEDAEAGRNWNVYATVCDKDDLDTLVALDTAEDEGAAVDADPPQQSANTALDIWNGWHHLRTRKAD